MQGHRSVAQADVTLGCPHDDRHDHRQHGPGMAPAIWDGPFGSAGSH
jgi:hypothetical protein